MINEDGLPTGAHKPALMEHLEQLVAFIGDSPLDEELEKRLNQDYGPKTARFQEMKQLLRSGIDENWACYQVIDGADYRRGRLGVTADGVHDFVIESARLKDVKGKYHKHPQGEINMIQPLDPQSRFCDTGEGWKVFAPGTSHYPTVTGGACTFIFLLPKGEIEYHED
jgi:2-hydroxylaminobenzoate mutase